MTNLTPLIAPSLEDTSNRIAYTKHYNKYYIHLYTEYLWFQYFKYFNTEAEAQNAVSVLQDMDVIRSKYWEEF